MEESHSRIAVPEPAVRTAAPAERIAARPPVPWLHVHGLQRRIGNEATGQLLAALGSESDARSTRSGDRANLGTTEPLPHLAQIQASFGRHDVTDVQSHIGGAASQAARRLGAQAFTVGRHVAFDVSPDLRMAAHEAAHAVQQANGARPEGGVGRARDPFERHANAVADAVVHGKSAEVLLDRVPGGREAASTQQRPALQLYERSEDGASAPTRPYWVEFDKGGRTWNGSEIVKNLGIPDPSIPRGLSIEWRSPVERQMAEAIVAGPLELVKLCQGLKQRIAVFQKEMEQLPWAPPPGIPDAAGCQEAWKVVHRIMIDTAFGGAHATLTYADLDRLAGYLHLFSRSLGADPSNPELLGEGTTWHHVPGGQLFVGEPTVADVRQGSGLGDCFFMSALAALVERDPALIKRNIKFAGTRGDKRFYWVLLYQRTGGTGSAQTFIEAPQLVDDDIVTTTLHGLDTGEPVFAHSNETARTKVVEAKAGVVNDPLAPGYDPFAAQQKTGPQPDLDTRELWPSLYEKAYAKLQGGYRKIDGGVGDEALAALTGKPSEMSGSIFSDDGLSTEEGPGAELWAKLWRVVEEEHRAVTAGTWQAQRRDGLFGRAAPVDSGHAYTVVRVSGSKHDPSSWTVTLRDPRGDRVGKEYVTLSFADFRSYFSRFMWSGL